ncbi:MAG: glycosyltransferase family 2 protein [Bacilli bacterium]|nr:glycosyltransferase family 2 protein [Bacilli bacterium]
MKKEKISIVVPCFNEEEALSIFYREMKKEEKKMRNVSFEYILVDDGSHDHTLDVMKKLSLKDESVFYLSFSRNFGKEAAMYAGLSRATGDYVTIMDADLQDPPFLLKEMYSSIVEEGYDCVGTRRVTRRGEPRIRSFFARQFYKIINRLSNIEMVDGARDFRLMTRQMVDSILELKEYNRYSKGLFSFVGFRTKWLEYENVKRCAGETKWSFFGLFSYALEGIVAFSTKPLVISAFIGLFFFLISFIMIFAILFRSVLFGDPVSGWLSTICILFFVSGVQLFCMAIFGMYLSKTYLETKKRPVFIIRDTNMK